MPLVDAGEPEPQACKHRKMINISSLSYYLPWRSSNFCLFHLHVPWVAVVKLNAHLFHLVIVVGKVIVECHVLQECCVLLEGEVTEWFFIKGIIKLKLLKLSVLKRTGKRLFIHP